MENSIPHLNGNNNITMKTSMILWYFATNNTWEKSYRCQFQEISLKAKCVESRSMSMEERTSFNDIKKSVLSATEDILKNQTESKTNDDLLKRKLNKTMMACKDNLETGNQLNCDIQATKIALKEKMDSISSLQFEVSSQVTLAATLKQKLDEEIKKKVNLEESFRKDFEESAKEVEKIDLLKVSIEELEQKISVHHQDIEKIISLISISEENYKQLEPQKLEMISKIQTLQQNSDEIDSLKSNLSEEVTNLKFDHEKLTEELSKEKEKLKIQRKQQEFEEQVILDLEKDFQYKKSSVEENKKWIENEIKKSLEIYFNKKNQELSQKKVEFEKSSNLLKNEIEKNKKSSKQVESKEKEISISHEEIFELQKKIQNKTNFNKSLEEKITKIDKDMLNLNIEVSKNIRILETLKEENRKIENEFNKEKEIVDAKMKEKKDKIENLDSQIQEYRQENTKKKLRKEEISKNISEMKNEIEKLNVQLKQKRGMIDDFETDIKLRDDELQSLKLKNEEISKKIEKENKKIEEKKQRYNSILEFNENFEQEKQKRTKLLESKYQQKTNEELLKLQKEYEEKKQQIHQNIIKIQKEKENKKPNERISIRIEKEKRTQKAEEKKIEQMISPKKVTPTKRVMKASNSDSQKLKGSKIKSPPKATTKKVKTPTSSTSKSQTISPKSSSTPKSTKSTTKSKTTVSDPFEFSQPESYSKKSLVKKRSISKPTKKKITKKKIEEVDEFDIFSFDG
eukprot:gene4200-7510_t